MTKREDETEVTKQGDEAEGCDEAAGCDNVTKQEGVANRVGDEAGVRRSGL